MSKLRLELDIDESVLPVELRTTFMQRVQLHAVLDMVREGLLSQSLAAQMLGLSRSEYFDLMSERHVDHITMTPDELGADVETALGLHRA